MSTVVQDGDLAEEGRASTTSSQPDRPKRDKKPGTSKRRTKTGCMTCRRRRIKCDEQKPICYNCRKSRRDCEGYNSSAAFSRRPYPQSSDTHHQDSRHAEVGPTFIAHSFSPSSNVNPSSLHTIPSQAPASTYPYIVRNEELAFHLRWPDNTGQGQHLGKLQAQAASRPTIDTLRQPLSQPGPADILQSRAHILQHPPIRTPVHLDSGELLSDDSWDFESSFDPETGLIRPRRSSAISPILEQEHRHVLDHFRVRLRPCISIYDRADNFDPHGGPGTTWGVVLPTAAISTPALAHAILAISLQHMSYLGAADGRFAQKHFWLSLKRSFELVANKPFDVATLATVLLLSFYNVITGDHAEWDLHLRGASRLVSQHDLAGMTRKVRRARARARENLRQTWLVHSSDLSYNDYVRISDIPQGLLNDKDWEVDDDLVKNLSGLDMDYLKDDVHTKSQSYRKPLTDHTAVEIKVYLDLYWWYCKMDILHGLLTGDPLLIPFESWSSCPPRGPIGDTDNISATLDHLLFVLGRLTDFGGRDRARKLRKAAQTGGRWVPVPGFFGPAKPPSPTSNTSSSGSSAVSLQNPSEEQNIPPSANEGRMRKKSMGQNTAGKLEGPSFYGMMPPPSVPPRMHSLFKAMDDHLHDSLAAPPCQPHGTTMDNLEKETHMAVAKHKSIEISLELWRSRLPPDFYPIPDVISVPEPSPFGPAVRYSHPLIATTWAMYYMALIVLRRFHPHSPAAAMMSSGVNALYTRDSALMIGRITAGLLMDLMQALRAGQALPLHYAALQEITFPLMVAGVQYQDHLQRTWTIDKLLFIATETGWKTSYGCASACEKTWEAMGKQGKGPHYERSVDRSRGPMATPSPQESPSAFEDMSATQHDPEARFIGHDREKIDRQPSSRAFFATGLLAVEADLAKLSMGT